MVAVPMMVMALLAMMMPTMAMMAMSMVMPMMALLAVLALLQLFLELLLRHRLGLPLLLGRLHAFLHPSPFRVLFLAIMLHAALLLAVAHAALLLAAAHFLRRFRELFNELECLPCFLPWCPILCFLPWPCFFLP